MIATGCKNESTRGDKSPQPYVLHEHNTHRLGMNAMQVQAPNDPGMERVGMLNQIAHSVVFGSLDDIELSHIDPPIWVRILAAERRMNVLFYSDSVGCDLDFLCFVPYVLHVKFYTCSSVL
jgi:hypothetical protein